MRIWCRGVVMIAALIVARKGVCRVDCRGASIRSDVGGVAYDGGRPGPRFRSMAVAPAVALDIHLEDGGVMDEAVDGGERHGGIGEDLAPFAEGLVGGDEHRAPLVAGADELEQHAGLGLVLGDVGEIVEDQQMEVVELVDGGFEGEFAARDLQLLDEVGGAGEQHAPAVLDEGQADGRREMALAAAGRAEQEQVGALLQPGCRRR